MVLIVMLVFFVHLFRPMDMDLPVEVLGLTPDQCRSNGRLDRKAALVTEPPLKNRPKETIDGVMPGLPLNVVLQPAMAFDGDHRRGLVFTWLELFTPRSTMRECRHRQGQGATCRP